MPKPTFFNLPEEKRERIVRVAVDEFADNDYQNVSISRLVEKADIAKGSFYQYFEDKADLYRHLLDLMVQEKMRLLSKEPPDWEMGIFNYLRWVAEESVRFELAYPRLSQVGYRALTGNDYPPDLVERMKAQSLSFFRQLVARGKAQGDIAPEIDDDLAAFIFHTVFTELGQYMWERLGDEAFQEALGADFYEDEAIQQIFSQTLEILERGMARRSGDAGDASVAEDHAGQEIG